MQVKKHPEEKISVKAAVLFGQVVLTEKVLWKQTLATQVSFLSCLIDLKLSYYSKVNKVL
jgi:hypothetical protein